jgi:hypothetical protein
MTSRSRSLVGVWRFLVELRQEPGKFLLRFVELLFAPISTVASDHPRVGLKALDAAPDRVHDVAAQRQVRALARQCQMTAVELAQRTGVEFVVKGADEFTPTVAVGVDPIVEGLFDLARLERDQGGGFLVLIAPRRPIVGVAHHLGQARIQQPAQDGVGRHIRRAPLRLNVGAIFGREEVVRVGGAGVVDCGAINAEQVCLAKSS